MKSQAWCSSPVMLIIERDWSQGISDSARMGQKCKACWHAFPGTRVGRSFYNDCARRHLQHVRGRRALVLSYSCTQARGFLEDNIQRQHHSTRALTSSKHTWNENATKILQSISLHYKRYTQPWGQHTSLYHVKSQSPISLSNISASFTKPTPIFKNQNSLVLDCT